MTTDPAGRTILLGGATHAALSLFAAIIGDVVAGSAAASGVLAGGAVGGLYLAALAAAVRPMFLQTDQPRRATKAVQALIVVKPLLLLGLTWGLLELFHFSPIGFVVGFLLLPASLALAGLRTRALQAP
ncbi:MAG: hypothetical protein HYY13_03190 [Nitrospirae bacterium]|nr:hypothetical protein [Nitrospirota bacterium]